MITQHCVIAIPTLNEAANLRSIVDFAVKDAKDMPVLIIDGGSTDGTVEIATDLAKRHPQVQFFQNPDRYQSAALNLAADHAASLGAAVLIRLDAHARYPEGFIGGVVRTLASEAADSVVVPLIADAGEGWQRANALLQRSWLGHGGADHRSIGPAREVAHGHHAAFRLSAFVTLGGYDPSFAANEDAEYDMRLTSNGGRIYLQPRWPVAYFPRSTPARAFAQFRRNGYWRVQSHRKNAVSLGPRQWLAVIAGIAPSASLLAGLLLPILALPALCYFALVVGLSLHAARWRTALAVQVTCLALLSHLGFGLGVLIGYLNPLPRPNAAKTQVPA